MDEGMQRGWLRNGAATVPRPQRLDRIITLLFVTSLRARHSHPRLDQAAAGRTARNKFRLARMVIVGDRGMITSVRIKAGKFKVQPTLYDGPKGQ